MKNTTLRFAKAFFEVIGNHALPVIQADEKKLAHYLREEYLIKLLEFPGFLFEQKKNILTRLFNAWELSQNIQPLFFVLLRQKKVFLIFDILKEYERLCYEHAGWHCGVIHAARPLASSEKNQLEKFFSQKLAQKVVFQVQLQASLIYGIKIVLDGWCYDYSLKGQMQSLKQLCLQHVMQL